MGVIQLEPQLMPGADVFDSTPGDPEEEERLRRELGAAVLAEVEPPPADAPATLRERAADAARVGADYRAQGAQPDPSRETVYQQPGHAGTYSVLRFDPRVTTSAPGRQNPPPSQAAAPAPSSQRQRLAALMLGGGRGAGTPLDRVPGVSEYEEAMRGKPAPQQRPEAQPVAKPLGAATPSGVDRARLLEAARAKSGERQPVDHTGADVADAVRRPLHAIGAALRAASGRSPGQFRSLGDESRRREAQAQQIDARAAQQESAARLAEMRMRQSGEEAAARREDRAADRELDERRLASLEAYRSGQIESRREADAALIGQRNAQRDRVAALMQRERDLDSLDSQITQHARQAYRDRLRLVPEHLRGQFPEDLADNLPARQIDRLHDQLSRYGIRDTRHARGGSGGRGNPLRRNAPEWWSGTDDEWRALGATGQRQEIQRHARAGASGEESGTEILPGVMAPIGMNGSEAQGIRSSIATAASSAANIRGLASIGARYGGASARISRDAQAELTPRLTVARGMVANLGNTGIINPSEVGTINAALPNPADLEQMTFGTLGRRAEVWQNLLESSIQSQLIARGVDDAGVRRVLQTIRSGSFSAGGGGGQRAQQQGARTFPEWVRVPGGRWTRMRDAETYREAQRRAQAAGVGLEER